jgi:HEAT repeat protein
MIEELNMRKRHGEEYEAYRRSAPFLFPLPSPVERAFALPFRLLFRRDRPENGWQAATVLGLYAALFMGASFLFYGNGMERLAAGLRSDEAQREYLARVVSEIRQEENWRSQSALVESLGRQGEAGVDALLELLRDEDLELREYAATTLSHYPSARALEALSRAVSDPAEDVRWRASAALGALGVPEVVDPLLPLLEDSASHIRLGVLQSLAALGAREAIPAAVELTQSQSARERAEGVRALGAFGSIEGLPTVVQCLSDEESWMREEAVIALLRIGSPDAIPALKEARGDEDRHVRMYAAEVVKRLR